MLHDIAHDVLRHRTPDLAVYDTYYDICTVWHSALTPRLCCSVRVYYACDFNNHAHITCTERA